MNPAVSPVELKNNWTCWTLTGALTQGLHVQSATLALLQYDATASLQSFSPRV